jgi:DHA1 family bicyclomycin/chloramphenicol resistance-like MFS transporter
MLFTIATTFAYGAFFPWLGSSVQMIENIYGRPDLFALLFGVNAAGMAMAILVTERAVARSSTFPVLSVLATGMIAVAALYVGWSVTADGRPPFWAWFLLATVLTALNTASTPLTQTLALEPMGRVAGTASSITGAIIFCVSAPLGALIDRAIVDSVTPFGFGFLIYGAPFIIAIATARRVAVRT